MKKMLWYFVVWSVCVMVASATQVVERPPFSVSNTTTIEVEKVELSNTATVLHFRAFSPHNRWYRMASESSIVANGRTYTVKYASGLVLDKEEYADSLSNERAFSLRFDPIDPATERIDFIEGNPDNCFKIWGIELKSKELTQKVTVPAEVLANASKLPVGPLKAPELKFGEATLSVHLLGFRLGLAKSVTVNVRNPVTNNDEKYELNISNEGLAEGRIPLFCSTQVAVSMPFFSSNVFLTPNDQTTLYLDLQQAFRQQARLRADRKVSGRLIYFAGANAELNNALLQLKSFSFYDSQEHFYKAIYQFSAKQYKEYLMRQYSIQLQQLKDAGYPESIQTLGIMMLQHDVLNLLLYGDIHLENAFRAINHLDVKATLTGFNKPVFDSDYFSFLKEVPLNDPLSLYVPSYQRVLVSVRAIQRLYFSSNKIVQIHYTAEMIQWIIDNEPLTPQELKGARSLQQEDSNFWGRERVAAYKQAMIQFCKATLQNVTLNNTDKQFLIDLQQEAERLDSKVASLEYKHSKFLYTQIENLTNDLRKNMALFKEQCLKYEPNAQTAEDIRLFTQKYGTILDALVNEEIEKSQYKPVAEILGTDKGIAFDLMRLQNLTRSFKESTPLTEFQLKTIRRFSNPFWAQYTEELNNRLKAKLATRQAKISKTSQNDYLVRENPVVDTSMLFETLIRPYAGKVVLVDYWATWCAPCRSAMQALEPYKDELQKAGVVFLYLTSPSSPLETWQNMIPDIKGEHYRLEEAQYRYLMDKLKSNGIPTYQIINKKGEQVYFSVGFEGVEKVVKLLKAELQKAE